MDTTLDAAKSALEEERAKLLHQLDELGATPSGELRVDADYGSGFADAAAATADRTERLGLADSLSSMLRDVEKALAKIAGGTYGVCDSCEEEIPAARLEVRPESVLCVSCKSQP